MSLATIPCGKKTTKRQTLYDQQACRLHEFFGTLQRRLGGKRGCRGVRGGQGKKRDKYQAYVTIDGKKVTVPG